MVELSSDQKVQARIRSAISKAFERLDADIDLRAIIGSWGDTLDDTEIAAILEDYLATGSSVHAAH